MGDYLKEAYDELENSRTKGAKMKLYSIKDKAQGFTHVFTANNKYNALRSFGDIINDQQKNVINQHPGDFSLFELGELDQETGAITSKIEFLEEAVNLAPKKAQE